jgi:DNA polymerase sigma
MPEHIPTMPELIELVCKTLRELEPIPRRNPYVLRLSDITESDRAAHYRAKHSHHRREAIDARAEKFREEMADKLPRRHRIRLVHRRHSQTTNVDSEASSPTDEQSSPSDIDNEETDE